MHGSSLFLFPLDEALSIHLNLSAPSSFPFSIYSQHVVLSVSVRINVQLQLISLLHNGCLDRIGKSFVCLVAVSA